MAIDLEHNHKLKSKLKTLKIFNRNQEPNAISINNQKDQNPAKQLTNYA